MPNYKLTYFGLRARGELLRLIFIQGGVKFEDIRIDRDTQWPQLKATMPFYQLPILEVDGVRICQSKAIGRLIARRCNLAGKTDWDQARADMVVDCFDDAGKTIQNKEFLFAEDQVVKAAIQKKYLEEELPASFAAIEKILKENKGGDGYFVGDELTWADLALLDFVHFVSVVGGDNQLPKYPKLHALYKKVEKLPKIADWVAKRPKTPL